MKKKILGVLAVGAVAAGVAAIVSKLRNKEDDFDGCSGDCESCMDSYMCHTYENGSYDMDDDMDDNLDDGPCDSTPKEEESGKED